MAVPRAVSGQFASLEDLHSFEHPSTRRPWVVSVLKLLNSLLPQIGLDDTEPVADDDVAEPDVILRRPGMGDASSDSAHDDAIQPVEMLQHLRSA